MTLFQTFELIFSSMQIMVMLDVKFHCLKTMTRRSVQMQLNGVQKNDAAYRIAELQVRSSEFPPGEILAYIDAWRCSVRL